MNQSNSRRAGGFVALLLGALLLAWWLLPTVDTDPTAEPLAMAPAPLAPLPVMEFEGGNDDAPAGEAEVVMVDPDLPPPTDKCTMIAGWAQRGVPHYTLLDNIRDQSMLFTEADLACLTAAEKVPPIVLRFAEIYQDKNQH